MSLLQPFSGLGRALIRPGRTTPAPVRVNLMARFVTLAGCVLCIGMVGIALWIGAQVERIVTANAGTTTALYVDSMVSPLVQNLDRGDGLPATDAERLAAMLGQGALSREVWAFKLWSTEAASSTATGQNGSAISHPTIPAWQWPCRAR